MKKTKLFTTLAAFILVLGLGACDTSSESTESESTSEETSEPTTPSETDALSNYTVAFSFVDEEGQATAIPEYATAYIVGDWDSWGAFLPLTEADGVYSYTFSSISVGTHAYKGVMYYSDETVTWNNCLEFITNEEGGDASLTVSESEGDGYTQVIEWTLTNVLEEKPEPVVTYVITIGNLGAAPEGIVLYAAGNFNGTWNETGSWWEWGDSVALTGNEDGTYNLDLYELPESGRSFEIVADDTTDEDQDMWDYVVGEYTFTADDVDITGGTEKAITVTTTYTSWTEDGGVFPPLGEEEEFYVLFVDGNGASTFSTTLYFTANVDCWDGGTQSSATQTKAGDNHIAFYSEKATAAKNTTLSFTITDGGGTNIQYMENATTLPDNSQGTPVFIAYCWLTNWIGANDNPWKVTVDFHTTDGWSYLTDGQTIADFASSYTAASYW